MLAPGVMHGTMFGDRIFLFSGKNLTIDPDHKVIFFLLYEIQVSCGNMFQPR